MAAIAMAALFMSGGFIAEAVAKGVYPGSANTYATLVRYEGQVLAAVRGRDVRRIRSLDDRLSDMARAGAHRFLATRGRKVDMCDSATIQMASVVLAARMKLEKQASRNPAPLLDNAVSYPQTIRACEKSIGVKAVHHPDLVSAVRALR